MSIDEALRALEKDLREEERQQLAESKRHAVDGDEETMQAFCNGKAFGLNTAAQRIAALLTTRQEVAPVAWQYRPRGSGKEWIDGEGSINSQYDSEYWEVRVLYDHPPLSTGQTSDARDGE